MALATADTWGIPGPAFLLAYGVTAGALIVAALAHRAAVLRGRRDAARPLTADEAALLNGGDRLAVYAALGELRAAGAISSAGRGLLVASGPLPPEASRLAWAVHQAAGQRVRVRELPSHPAVAATLAELRDRLHREGLLATPGQRRAARLVPLVLLGLVALGVVRLAAGIAGGKPVGYLVLLLLVVSVVTALLLATVPRHTRAARAALAELRARHRHLAPAQSPAFATYGAAGAAMSIAIFGAPSLWEMDPAFASAAEVQRGSAAFSGSGTHTSGGDGGGGASCGGGGCGGGGCGG